MSETGAGAFRESADEDPRGTRALAMRLTPAGRELLSRPAAALWPRVVFALGSVALLAMIASPAIAVSASVVALLFIAFATGERLTPRFLIDDEALTVVSARGHQTRHRWRDVERFTLGRDAARATIGSATFEARAVRRQGEAWLGLDQAVADADWLIERGMHRMFLTCCAFASVMLAAVMLGWITLAWGFAASILALVVVNLAIRAPDAVLSADGIDTGFDVLPWSRIQSGARRNRLLGHTLEVQLDDGSQRTFVVPERARAEALVIELHRRKAAAQLAAESANRPAPNEMPKRRLRRAG